MMWFIIIGLFSGVLSSLGLGGGTVLIPLLSLLGIEQKSAQVINVAVFMVMVIFLIVTKSQKEYLDPFVAIVMGVVGGVVAFISSTFVKELNGDVLKTLFGIFLIGLSMVESIIFIKKYRSKK